MHRSNLPCPCGESSDAFSIQENGWGRCFGKCGGRNFPPGVTDIANSVEINNNEPPFFTALTEVFRSLPSRGLTEATIERYKAHVGKEEDTFVTKYPRFSSDGRHVGNKVRRKTEEPRRRFYWEGDKEEAVLFGMNSFPPGSAKYITITEGQDDAMAVYQMSGSKYPCISIDGSSSAEKDLRDNFEYINSFENIVLCFDNDTPGLEAVKKALKVPFQIGKVKVLTLRDHKDANDYLLNKKVEQFLREWWAAPVHKPDGLKLGTELYDEIINRRASFTTNYPWPGLNRLTYGLRLGEMVIINAPTKVGKTSIIKAIEHQLLTDPEVIEKGYGVGFMHLEEPNGDTGLGLLSLHNGVPYHLPDVERPEEDLRRAYDELLNNNRVVIWDHFGSNEVEAVLEKVRHMHAMGCRYIVIDHLSIIVSDQSGDERKQLDQISTKLKTLTLELDISVIAVVHQNREGQIRGTAGIEQLANIVIRLHRDKLDMNEWRRNVTKVMVTENRFCGYTGPATYLFYDKDTTRFKELTDDEIQIYEEGGIVHDQGF